jgi:peptidoglycan/LPS O-acetylase OafA/YrhL
MYMPDSHLADTAQSKRSPMTFRQIVNERHLPALDGLRAIAVFTVMLYHYTASPWIPGDLGVSLFFVISGFLITLLLLREYEKTATVSLRGFYLRRTLRIFPAYYAFILFSLTVDWVRGHRWTHGLFFAAVGYAVNYYNALNGHPVTSVSHAWSLADEEQFYLLWPIIFLIIASRPARTARMTLIGIIIAVVAWRSYLYLGRAVGAAYVYNAFDTRFDNLAIGCLLAFLASGKRVARVGSAIASSAWMPLVTVALLYASRVFAPSSYHYSIGFTVDAILMAVLITQLMQLTTTSLWSWLDHPITRYIGAISYPLYLYHAWGMSAATHLGKHGVVVTTLMAAGASTVLACGSYYLVEKPFLRMKRHLEDRAPHPETLLGATQP